MNDKQFIELLNLYVDQELTDEEARVLEREIAQRPERRQVYTQYCRMQRACVRLFEQQAAPVPQIERLAGAAVSAGPSETVEFPVPIEEPVTPVAPNRWGRFAWAGGMLAAAACVALVALRQTDLPATAPSVAATPKVEQAVQVVADTPAANPAAARGADYQPVVMVNTLLRSESDLQGRPAGEVAALDPQSLDWLQEMKLLPMRRVPFETFRFDAQGRLEAVDHATFASDQADPANATEISAFQFQR